MSSRKRSARRVEAAPPESPALAQARAQIRRLIDGGATDTETVFDQIARCDDFRTASHALARAISATTDAVGARRTLSLADRVLPAPGALLPP